MFRCQLDISTLIYCWNLISNRSQTYQITQTWNLFSLTLPFPHLPNPQRNQIWSKFYISAVLKSVYIVSSMCSFYLNYCFSNPLPASGILPSLFFWLHSGWCFTFMSLLLLNSSHFCDTLYPDWWGPLQSRCSHLCINKIWKHQCSWKMEKGVIYLSSQQDLMNIPPAHQSLLPSRVPKRGSCPPYFFHPSPRTPVDLFTRPSPCLSHLLNLYLPTPFLIQNNSVLC